MLLEDITRATRVPPMQIPMRIPFAIGKLMLRYLPFAVRANLDAGGDYVAEIREVLARD